MRKFRHTVESIDYIKKHWDSQTNIEMGRYLGCSSNAVRVAGIKVGLPAKKSSPDPEFYRMSRAPIVEVRYSYKGPPLARPSWFDEPEIKARLKAGR